MRLFFDANTLTYIAMFEGYLVEGTREEFQDGITFYEQINRAAPGEQVLNEINALRALYRIDDHARFDWLCSDVAVAEIEEIANQRKRSAHRGIIESIIEHRRDVYESEGRIVSVLERADLAQRLFPDLPSRMQNDALQFCEAELVDADFFVTNDRRFIRKARLTRTRVQAYQASALPFIGEFGSDARLPLLGEDEEEDAPMG